MNSMLDDAILKMLPNTSSLSDEIASYITLSNNIALKRAYYQNIKLSEKNFKLALSIEREYSLLLILFSLYWKKRNYRDEFFISRNKMIRFLALCYIPTREKNFINVATQLGKPYIKKQGYLLDNFLSEENITSRAATFLISILPPYHLISKKYVVSAEFIDGYRGRLRSFGKDSFSINYYYLQLIGLKNNLTFDDDSISLMEISNIIDSPLGKRGENLLSDLLPYLNYDNLINLIPFISNLDFNLVVTSNKITYEEKCKLLSLYPRSIIALVEKGIPFTLPQSLHLELVNFIYQSSQDNQTYLYLAKLLSPEYASNHLSLLVAVIKQFPSKRLYKLLSTQRYTPLEAILELPAELALTSYWNTPLLIDFIFNQLSPGEHATFRLLLREFDGTILELLEIVKSLRSNFEHQ